MTPWSAVRSEDQGDASIQNAILFPAVMLLLVVIIQGGLYFYAQNVARNAATSAVQVTRSLEGTEAEGYQEANQVLDLGGTAFQGRHVQVSRQQTTVTVTITGQPLEIIPLGLTIEQSASGAVERFTGETP